VSDSHSTTDLWRKSSHSGGGNDCVEIAFTAELTGIRDSKDHGAGHLALSPRSLRALLAASVRLPGSA
jgi:hypothetical protein